MNKVKKLFNSFILSFAIIGALFCGLTFYGLADNKNSADVSADTNYENVKNESLPQYFVPTTTNAEEGIDGNHSLYLVKTNGLININLANSFVDGIIDKSTTPYTQERNYAYYPDLDNPDVFYYFNFENTLALYYNVTNEDIEAGLVSEDNNLLNSQPLSVYASQYPEEEIKILDGENEVDAKTRAFRINEYDFVPKNFKMSFGLNTNLTTGKPVFEQGGENAHVITLDKEGCYTLGIPYTYYKTEDGGNTFIERVTEKVFYSFMVFNSSTYLDSASNLPNTQISSFVQTSSLINNITHSRYYFYNYSETGKNNLVNGNAPLPTYTYNPNLYELTVNYTDIDEVAQKVVLKLEYDLNLGQNKIVSYKVNNDGSVGEMIEAPFYIRYDAQQSQATLTFNDLGTYNISFDFIYKEGNKTFNLPLKALDQRLYMFGFQSYYTTQEKDAITNTTISKELKHVEESNSSFDASADITSTSGCAISQHTSEAITAENIKTSINLNTLSPVSTNQTPIKFRKNANVTLNAGSRYYPVTFDENGKNPTIGIEKEYNGDNFKDAGTYLVVTIYTYQNYLSSTGTQQSSYYHYQIFYFTITNTTPSVSVMALDKNKNETTLYTDEYTNKDVLILDNSTNSEYDASVTLRISAKDYSKENSYFFGGKDFESSINFSDLTANKYSGITYYSDLSKANLSDDQKAKYENKAGLYISTDSPYHNATFTIYIKSANSQYPSSRAFTIDTNPIGDIKAKTATFSTNSNYTIGEMITSNKTNQPMIFYWNEKSSNAQTYGYFKYYEITDAKYYDTSDSARSNNSRLLKTMLERNNIVPVNSMLDLSSEADWTRYTNAKDYVDGKTISSSYVRSASGLYIFEVFDEAGNSSFEVYLLDNTSPIFVKKLLTVEDGNYDLYIMSGTETVTVSKEYELSIHWGEKKGIYIKGFPSLNNDPIYRNYQNDNLGDFTTLEDNPLKTEFNDFFNKNSEEIKNIQNLTPPDTTKIENYNGKYLTIPLADMSYISAIKGGYKIYNEKSYTINFFEIVNGEEKENEGAYKFLLRDQSNTNIGHNENGFKLAPSAYITIHVSSDSSELKFIIDNDADNPVSPSGYSLTGKFYQDTSDNEVKLVKNNLSGSLDASDKSYKYAYYTPIKTTKPLSISFIPFAENGSVVQSIKLNYYPFVKKDVSIPMQDHSTNASGQANTFTAKAYYYTLSQEPSRKDLNIFTLTSENQGSILTGEVQTYKISFSGNDIAEPGKYVITRTYSTGATIDRYDYYERDLILIVDRNGIISKQEEISNGDYKSLESIVGGDINIAMYSETGNNSKSSISLAYPSYDNETGLNSGSLYTTSSMEENTIATTLITSNKLPLSVNVPKYKYTLYNEYNYSKNSYKVNINDKNSYYGDFAINEETDASNETVYSVYTEVVYNEDKTLNINDSILLDKYSSYEEALTAIEVLKTQASITEYELYAKIRYTSPEDVNALNPTWYRTNGTTSDGNYLNFYQINSEHGDFPNNATPVANFSAPGTYVVTIYQASNQSAGLEGNSAFDSLYKFAFEITSPTPDFTVVKAEGNTELDSVTQNSIVSYYTNTQKVRVRWEDPTSEFLAKIDKQQIYIQSYESLTAGVPVKIDPSSIQSQGNIYWFDIDLTQIAGRNIWKNGNRVKVTMQYEGYTSDNAVSKFITIDYTAPTEILASLMDKVSSSTDGLFSRNYQEKKTRSLSSFDKKPIDANTWVEGTDISSLMENVSYSYTAGSDNFKNYSYTVDKSFFENAYNILVANASAPTNSQNLYIKTIDQSTENDVLSQYSQVTDGSFSKFDGNYRNLVEYYDEMDTFLQSNNYYEIVELDTAGNMVVYIVYYNDQTADLNAISYTNNRLQDQLLEEDRYKNITNSQLVDGYNIYSNSGFTLTDLNYNEDPWAVYKITINGISNTYMLSPIITTEGQLHKLGLDKTGLTFTPVNISELFTGVESSSNKHHIQIADRTTGLIKNVYVAVMDANLETFKLSDENTAILQIAVPSAEQVNSTTTAYIYPTKINIYRWDEADGSGEWNNDVLANAVVTTGNPQDWQALNTGILTFSYENGRLVITIKVENNYSTKFKYEIEDNFGNLTTVVQLVNEETCQEIVATSQYYTTTESTDNSTTYLSAGDLTYQFNRLIYDAKVRQVLSYGVEIDEDVEIIAKTGSISAIRLQSLGKANYDKVYIIDVYEKENPETVIKTINLRIYDRLPVLSMVKGGMEGQNNIWFLDKDGQIIDTVENIPELTVTFRDKTITTQATAITTFSSNVTACFNDGQIIETNSETSYNDQYTYSVYISQDGHNWTSINEEALTGHMISGAGSYYVMIAYDKENLFTDVNRLFMINILNSSTVSYYFHVNGLPATPRKDFKYTAKDTQEEISTVYVLNIDYEDKDAKVVIEGNEQLGTVWNNIRLVKDTSTSTAGVEVEIYTYSSNITKNSTFAVIYIGETPTILSKLSYDDATGSSVDLLQINDPANPKDIVASVNAFDKLKITWNKYYGIAENEVNVEVSKLFNGEYVKVNIIPNKNDPKNSFIYLTRAGTYRLKFYDSCEVANVHKFNRSEYINITFLNNVPFTIKYTDPVSQEEMVSEPINRAVYNGTVKLALTNPSEYFASGYPIISVMKDGKEYTKYTKEGVNTFVFSENGYYSVSFEAMSINQEEVRKENYVFSIINSNESRFAFEYSTYSNYYVKQILKDGIDVTDRYTEIIDDNKININGKYYLTNLQISYLDEKTGFGRYIITIETGEQTYANTTATSFTFGFRINLITPPVNVSISAGESTSKEIVVSYNAKNLYDTVGDCIIKIPGYKDIIINAEADINDEMVTKPISVVGTNYVQVYNMSGSLLFSYKITRTKPLNAWSIIAIVIAVAVVAVIVFITIKLRKRLKVK